MALSVIRRREITADDLWRQGVELLLQVWGVNLESGLTTKDKRKTFWDSLFTAWCRCQKMRQERRFWYWFEHYLERYGNKLLTIARALPMAVVQHPVRAKAYPRAYDTKAFLALLQEEADEDGGDGENDSAESARAP